MPRYKLTIEYDGRPFVGWQVQDNGPTVQGMLLAAVKAFCGQEVTVHGAGRTDAGVHALGQVAHVDLTKDWDAETVRDAVNAHLRPHPVAVIAAEQVGFEFDARFSAVKRHYLYRIINRRADLTFERGRAWRVAKPLNSGAMHAAAQRLVGRHDFTTFRHVECQAKSPVKTLDTARRPSHQGRHPHHRGRRARSCTPRCARWSARWCWSAKANGSADDMAGVLAARDRTACGPVAPPDGLYLMQVDYE